MQRRGLLCLNMAGESNRRVCRAVSARYADQPA